MKNFSMLNKNTRALQILTKSDLILEQMRKNEERQRLNKKTFYQHPRSLISELNNDYNDLVKHKEVNNDEWLQLQLIPQTSQYFFMSIGQIAFPISIHLKDIYQKGQIYVSFDRQYPGIESNSLKSFYDLKDSFEKNKTIRISPSQIKNVKRLFITISTNKTTLTLKMKVSFLDHLPLIPQSEYRYYFGKTFILPPLRSKKKQRIKTAVQQNSIEEQAQISSKSSLSRSVSCSKIISVKKKTFQTSSIYKKNSELRHMDIESEHKKKIVQAFTKEKNIQKSPFCLKKSLKCQNYEKVKETRDYQQLLVVKNRQLKRMAAKFRLLIDREKKNEEINLVKKKKIQLYLSPLIYTSLFLLKSTRLFNERVQTLEKSFMVHFLMNKFIRKIKKQCFKIHRILSGSKNRNGMGIFLCLQMQTRFLKGEIKQKAYETLTDTFSELLPVFHLRKACQKSEKYLERIIKIQTGWKRKYKARIFMLKNYGFRHVQKMLHKHPNLRMMEEKFYEKSICNSICYQYIKDEAIKYRYILSAYFQTLLDIEKVEEKNEELIQQNKKLLKKNKKKLLEIPLKPDMPIHRFFRNVDILQSMLRAWFELESKKQLKKSLYE